MYPPQYQRELWHIDVLGLKKSQTKKSGGNEVMQAGKNSTADGKKKFWEENSKDGCDASILASTYAPERRAKELSYSNIRKTSKCMSPCPLCAKVSGEELQHHISHMYNHFRGKKPPRWSVTGKKKKKRKAAHSLEQKPENQQWLWNSLLWYL